MTGEMTFIEIMKISIVLPILLVMSIFAFMVLLERIVCFFRYARVSQKLLDKVRTSLKAGNINEAKKTASHGSGFTAQAVLAHLESAHLPRSERESLILFYHQKFQMLLNKRLWIFGTLSFICPLVGLFGTVLGVMTAFGDMAVSGSGGATIVAAGISEALWATAAGIGLAITSAVVYNIFNIWMKNSLARLDIFAQEMILMTVGK